MCLPLFAATVLLSSAAAAVNRLEQTGTKTTVDSPNGVGLPWIGAALLDGLAWPVRDATTVWIPAGKHTLEPGGAEPGLRIEDFNGSLKSAVWSGRGIDLTYESSSRVFCRLSKAPSSLEVDGEVIATGPGAQIVLPKGQHIVTVR